MRVVQKFVADDGLEFADEAKCVKYEAMCKQVTEIMATLAPIPDLPSSDFVNGAGYIQHHPATAKAARAALLTIANTVWPHTWFEQSIADDSVHSSWAGRLISEMNEKCLRHAWARFDCMTSDFREYGQPYFANNPDRAQNICLNGPAKEPA